MESGFTSFFRLYLRVIYGTLYAPLSSRILPGNTHLFDLELKSLFTIFSGVFPLAFRLLRRSYFIFERSKTSARTGRVIIHRALFTVSRPVFYHRLTSVNFHFSQLIVVYEIRRNQINIQLMRRFYTTTTTTFNSYLLVVFSLYLCSRYYVRTQL